MLGSRSCYKRKGWVGWVGGITNSLLFGKVNRRENVKNLITSTSFGQNLDTSEGVIDIYSKPPFTQLLWIGLK